MMRQRRQKVLTFGIMSIAALADGFAVTREARKIACLREWKTRRIPSPSYGSMLKRVVSESAKTVVQSAIGLHRWSEVFGAEQNSP